LETNSVSTLSGENLVKKYGKRTVVNSISLNVKQGEIVGLLGPNGAGKTTTFYMITGMIQPNAGDVKFGDKLITKLPMYKRARYGIAYLPQEASIFRGMTVEENIETGLAGTTEKTIPDYIYEIFPVLHEMRKRRGGNLSGGQQQQLAIARALVSRPKVLLLDEPTEGIQPSIIKEMAQVLKKIRDRNNLSILVSEQVLSFVKIGRAHV